MPPEDVRLAIAMMPSDEERMTNDQNRLESSLPGARIKFFNAETLPYLSTS